MKGYLFHNPTEEMGASLSSTATCLTAEGLQAKSSLAQPALSITTAGRCLLSYRSPLVLPEIPTDGLYTKVQPGLEQIDTV